MDQNEKEWCPSCNTLKNHDTPGKDSYDILEQTNEGDQIALCSDCLGTGISVASTDFVELGRRVSALRVDILSLLVVNNQTDKEKISDLNKKLVDIAKIGLQMVKKPVPGCYAEQLMTQKK